MMRVCSGTFSLTVKCPYRPLMTIVGDGFQPISVIWRKGVNVWTRNQLDVDPEINR